MFQYYEDENENSLNCIYTQKYGVVNLKSTHFDDHSLLGANFFRYKPEKIKIWVNNDLQITGIQTWFTNIIDKSTINSGENKGLGSVNHEEFTINPNQYLARYEIWKGDNTINGLVLETNKGEKFEVGKKSGKKFVSEGMGKNKIIISFFGSYNKVLESLGFHLLEKNDYMRVLFTGYFELKAKFSYNFIGLFYRQ